MFYFLNDDEALGYKKLYVRHVSGNRLLSNVIDS